MTKKLTKKTTELFESLKKIDSNGQEWWSGRDIARTLEYSEYRNFLPVMRKAWSACCNSGQNPKDHFVIVHEMVSIGSNAEREIETVFMSRYGCYLSMQNANPSKPIVGQAQTYFALQTRRAEIELDTLTDEENKRLLLRSEMATHNSHLASAAKNAGVKTSKDYAIFQSFGYRGLYGGLDAQDIHNRKGLSPNQKILDHMSSTELAANLFRATQTEEKLRKEGISNKESANKIHHLVGAKVRKTIKDLGGTMPEDLPAVDSIHKLMRKQQRLIGKRSTNTQSEKETDSE